MPKRKLHLDGPEPRGVTQAPHTRRTRKPTTAAQKAAAAMRHEADEAVVSFHTHLGSSATLVIGRSGGLSAADELSAQPLPNLLATDDSVVVLPNSWAAAAAPTPAPAAEAAPPETAAEPLDDPDRPEAAIYARNLLKLQVPVAAVIAERRLPIGRVLHIAPGTVLRFGKPCDQPLELEAGGHRIAIGEAVTVGERFGLRITALTR